MKKAFIVFLALISLLFTSCSEEKYYILPFENRDAIIECTVNDKFSIEIEKCGGTLSLSVLSPDEIRGVSFIFSDSGDKMISDKIDMPVSRNELLGIYSVASVLELTEEAMTSAASKGGTGEIIIEKNGLTYTLIFASDGEMTDIGIIGNGLNYSIKVNKLTVL